MLEVGQKVWVVEKCTTFPPSDVTYKVFALLIISSGEKQACLWRGGGGRGEIFFFPLKEIFAHRQDADDRAAYETFWAKGPYPAEEGSLVQSDNSDNALLETRNDRPDNR